MADTILGKILLTPKGTYNNSTTYEKFDVIQHEGSTYLVLKGVVGETPPDEEYYQLMAARGADGEDGEDGADGVTPHIGDNGNWFVGNKDTGVKARGDDGDDYVLTEADKSEIANLVPTNLPNGTKEIVVTAKDDFKKGELAYLIRDPSEPYDVNYHSTLEGNYEYFSLSPFGDAVLLAEYSDEKQNDMLYVYSLEDGELTKVKNNYLSDLHLIDKRRVAFSKNGKWLAVLNNTIHNVAEHGDTLKRKHIEMYSVSGSTLVKVDSLSMNSTDIDLSTAPFGFNEDGSLFIVSNRLYSFTGGKLRLLEELTDFTSTDVLGANFDESGLLISASNKVIYYDNYRSSNVTSRWHCGDKVTSFIPKDGYMTIGSQQSDSTLLYYSPNIMVDGYSTHPLTVKAKFRLSESAAVDSAQIRARMELRTFDGKPAYMSDSWRTLTLTKDAWVDFESYYDLSREHGTSIHNDQICIRIEGMNYSRQHPIDVCECITTMTYDENAIDTTKSTVAKTYSSPNGTINVIEKTTAPHKHLNIESEDIKIDGVKVPVYDFGTNIVFSNDDSMFVTCGDSRYEGYTASRVYKIEDRVAIDIGQLLDADGNIITVKTAAFSNENKLLAVACDDALIRLYQTDGTFEYAAGIYTVKANVRGAAGTVLTANVNDATASYTLATDEWEAVEFELDITSSFTMRDITIGFDADIDFTTIELINDYTYPVSEDWAGTGGEVIASGDIDYVNFEQADGGKYQFHYKAGDTLAAGDYKLSVTMRFDPEVYAEKDYASYINGTKSSNPRGCVVDGGIVVAVNSDVHNTNLLRTDAGYKNVTTTSFLKDGEAAPATETAGYATALTLDDEWHTFEIEFKLTKEQTLENYGAIAFFYNIRSDFTIPVQVSDISLINTSTGEEYTKGLDAEYWSYRNNTNAGYNYDVTITEEIPYFTTAGTGATAITYIGNNTGVTFIKSIGESTGVPVECTITNMDFSANGESLIAITSLNTLETFSVSSTAYAYRSLNDAPKNKFYEIAYVSDDVVTDSKSTAKIYLKIHTNTEEVVKNNRVKLYATDWLEDGTSDADNARSQRIGYVDPSIYDPDIGGSDSAVRLFYDTSVDLPSGVHYDYDTVIGYEWKEIDIPFEVINGTGKNLALSFLGGGGASTQSYEIKDIAIYDSSDPYQTNLINAPIATADIVASGSNTGVCVLNDGETDYIHISDQNKSYRQIHYYTETDFPAGMYRLKCKMRRSPKINIQSVVANGIKRDDVVFTNTDHRIYPDDTCTNAYSIAKGDNRVIFSCSKVPDKDITAEVVAFSSRGETK